LLPVMLHRSVCDTVSMDFWGFGLSFPPGLLADEVIE
jgi:hypothetical protein